MVAQDCAVGQYRQTLLINDQANARGVGQFPQARGNPTLGRVVEGVHAALCECKLRVPDNTDPRRSQHGSAAVEPRWGQETAEFSVFFVGDQRCAFNGNAFGQDLNVQAARHRSWLKETGSGNLRLVYQHIYNQQKQTKS